MTSHPAARAKGSGVTESERYLKSLCEKSFLSLWSYPGVHNNKGPGQEVCDLLVVFENHVIIFSDKNCKYLDTGDLQKDWKRWYRRAIQGSVKQIVGAERWIRQYPDRLFLDQSCKTLFPIPIPTNPTFHRIVVTQSIAEHCRTFFGGGTGSLLFDSECTGDEFPFTIGRVGGDRGFIHILDDSSLDIVLQTLDTAPDFINYLEKKERFLTSGLSVAAAGEEELLGHYLEGQTTDGDHDFLINVEIENAQRIVFEEGYWNGFSNHKSRQIQIEANRISYFWDSLIENISGHIINGTAYANSVEDIATNEKLLRLLAKENRTKRRFLSDAFLNFIQKTPPGYRSTRRILPSLPGEPYYVFFVMPSPKTLDYDKGRYLRRELLAMYCAITRLEHSDAYDVIGIATEAGALKGRSEDLVYLNTRNWTKKDIRRAEKDRDYLRSKGFISTTRHRFRTTLYEYPATAARTVGSTTALTKGNGRNSTCHCGSGRKFKKCHGAAA